MLTFVRINSINIARDIRNTVRTWRRNPGSTIAAYAALTVSIAAAITVFSVLSSLLISPLPVGDSEHVVIVTGRDRTGGLLKWSLPTALDVKQRMHNADALAVYRQLNGNLGGEPNPAMVRLLETDADLFTVMGVRMAQGHAFKSNANQPGQACEVVISWPLWKSRFGGAAISGRMIRLNERPCQVDGVLPEKLDLPLEVDAWVPKSFNLAAPANKRQVRSLFAMAHLRNDSSVASFNAELATISNQLCQENQTINCGVQLRATPLRDSLSKPVEPALLILFGAVSLVLLMACANVANLLLARASSRLREISVRMALGATREAIFRQLLTESLLLALTSSLSALIVSIFAVRLVRHWPNTGIPRPEAISIDWRVVVFAMFTAVLTGLLFGIWPALRVSGTSLTGALSQAAGRLTESRHEQMSRKILIGGEAAIATVLLIGSLLLLRSFHELSQVDLGFQTDHLLTAYVSLNAARYGRDTNDSARFARNVIERLRGKQGIEAATFTTNIPLRSTSGHGPVQIDGRPLPANPMDSPQVLNTGISPSYRRTLNIPLKAGVDFDDRDDRDDASSILVNTAFARLFFPNESALGKRIRYSPELNPDSPWQQIVGVMGDTRQSGPEDPPQPEIYRPMARMTSPYPAIIIRTKDNPLPHLRDIEAAVHEVDSELPLFFPLTMEQLEARKLGLRTFFTALLTGFAVVAVVLAGGGIFAVIAYSVSQRTAEIGVRMACGATQGDVLRLIVLEALLPAVAGTGTGVAAALVLNRYLVSLLYGVQPGDALSFAGSALLLIMLSGLAALWPAWRAARVAPWRALHYE